MKRLFILASAAIVALASCTKTQVVYTEAPEEISFKAFTGAMTKATLGDNAWDNMGVYAYKADGTTEYFAATKFEEGTTWTAVTGSERYWPGNDDLQFVVWAPFEDGWTYTPASKTLIYTATSMSDILYGESIMTTNKTASASGVDITMKRAAAKVSIKFTGEEGVSVLKSLKLVNVAQTGTCTVVYDGTAEAEWAPGSLTEHPFTIDGGGLELEGTATEDSTFELLVVPVASNTATISFDYELAGSSASYVVPAGTVGDWEEGTHYTYTVNVGADEIEIVPTVTPFVPEEIPAM